MCQALILWAIHDHCESWLACDSHRYLHNSEAIDGNHDAKRAALDLDLAFDLKRPVKPRWPNAGLKSWATRQDAGLAAPRHGWRVAAAPQITGGLRAHRAQARCRVVGQEPFWLLLGLFSKSDPL